MKKIFLPLLLFICMLLAACAPAAPAEAPAAEIAEPTVTPHPVVMPDPDIPIATPEPTPMPEVEYSEDELYGEAGEDEVLPDPATYEEAKAKNDEVIGWITIEGTAIDYPVTRTDNNQYYLARDAYKNKSKHGSIHMDFRNADPAQQRQLLIYGHNMRNGTMFHDLNEYKSGSFFKKHNTVSFNWEGTPTEWRIFLAYIVAPDTVYHLSTQFADGEAFAKEMNDLIAYAKTVSPMNYDGETEITAEDQVLTLSTCTYEYSGSFFVVMAKRIS